MREDANRQRRVAQFATNQAPDTLAMHESQFSERTMTFDANFRQQLTVLTIKVVLELLRTITLSRNASDE